MPAPTVFNAATGQLVHATAITNPTGGTPDAEARTATNAILAVLRNRAVIAGATSMNLGQTFNGPTSQIVQAAAIAAPTGGSNQDTNVRAAINSIRTVLQNAGLIAGATTTLGAHSFDEDTYNVTTGAAIADVTGGATIDTQCRTAINAALAAMRLAGLIAAD
jgi:hypothetical protein